eukprot:UN31728
MSIKTYKKVNVEPDCIDNFKIFFGDFLSTAKDAAGKLHTKINNLSNDIIQLAKDFGEEPRNEKDEVSAIYLKSINKFCKDTQAAVQKNVKRDQARKRREKLKAKEAEKEKKRQLRLQK